MSRVPGIVTRLYSTLLGYLGLLKQAQFTSKYSDNFDQNEIIMMMNMSMVQSDNYALDKTKLKYQCAINSVIFEGHMTLSVTVVKLYG